VVERPAANLKIGNFHIALLLTSAGRSRRFFCLYMIADLTDYEKYMSRIIFKYESDTKRV